MEDNVQPKERTPFFCQLDNERHPATADRYQCVVCGRLICINCYEAQNIVGLSFCPFCEGKLTLIKSLGSKVVSSVVRSQVEQSPVDIPLDPPSWIERGKNFENQGRNMEALECYTRGLKSFPQDSDLWKNKAFVLESLSFHEAAIDCYNEVLKINPVDSDALNNKGVSLGSLKRYDEALECYDKAIQLNSEDVEAWFNRGAVLELLHHPDAALTSYKKALLLDPTDAEIQKKVLHLTVPRNV